MTLRQGRIRLHNPARSIGAEELRPWKSARQTNGSSASHGWSRKDGRARAWARPFVLVASGMEDGLKQRFLSYQFLSYRVPELLRLPELPGPDRAKASSDRSGGLQRFEAVPGGNETPPGPAPDLPTHNARGGSPRLVGIEDGVNCA
ncbi:hypothetical protein CDD80_908 [Ophiocordyceps camponoti-rufipedis]|uniref:Uncharacterized protein n=1 Tax=Ophiocordyceps camponoti-rufipedis TaxID=2004952 RepID=A0A2C5ZBH4_9HYPO|nr:hypothetical protein CDD80_908 [Ophiocordyceps camponoti-rufipedis]